jgi:hypothetical protein
MHDKTEVVSRGYLTNSSPMAETAAGAVLEPPLRKPREKVERFDQKIAATRYSLEIIILTKK